MVGLGRNPIVILDEDQICTSGCSDTECDGPLCNVNFALGHVKCYAHMLEQRGVPCNVISPCHTCRSRLVEDTTGEHRKHMIKCESDRVAAQARRQARSNITKKNQNSSLSVVNIQNRFTTVNFDLFNFYVHFFQL